MLVGDAHPTTIYEFTQTPGTNRIRDPEGYRTMARIQDRIWIGSIIDYFV